MIGSRVKPGMTIESAIEDIHRLVYKSRMQLILSAFSGLLVGSSLGVFGSGGSTLAIPLLTYVIGLPPKTAIASSLAIVGCSAASGTLHNLRSGSVNLKVGFLYGATGILGSLFGTQISVHFTGLQQLLLFSVVVFAAALSMVQKAYFSKKVRDETQDQSVNPIVGGGSGFLIGILTGLVGVGGGFLIVPVLHSLGVTIRRAIGTSLMIIMINAFSGAIGYLGKVEYDFPVLGMFIATAMLSSQVGARWVQKLDVHRLKKSYALFLLVLGAFLVLKNSFDMMS